MNYSATVLRRCLEDERTLFECVTMLSEKMFPEEDDRVLWNVIFNLHKKGLKVTPAIVLDMLKRNQEQAAIVQLTYIMKMQIDPQQVNYAIYSIRETYNQKCLRELGKYLTEADSSIESKDIIRYSEKVLYELEEGSVEDISLVNISEKTVNTIERVQRGEDSVIIKSGIRVIDQYAPFSKAQQVLIAADNGTGKTALMIQLSKNFSELNENIAIYFVSLDVIAEKIFRRMICNEVGLTDKELVKRGSSGLSKEQIDQIRAYRDKLMNDKRYCISFLDRNVSIHQIVAKANKFIKMHEDRHPIIILDNLDKVRNDGLEGLAQQNLVSSSMLGIVREKGATTIILHHLTKEHQKNVAGGARPTKNDIRGSGKLQDDADMIYLLFRPDNYPDMEGGEPNVMEIIVDKSRDDNVLNLKIAHDIQFYRFFDKPKRDEEA